MSLDPGDRCCNIPLDFGPVSRACQDPSSSVIFRWRAALREQMNPNEAVVASTRDLQDGEMKQVCVGQTDVLLARVQGKFYATGAYCNHQKAPLCDGVLSGDRVVCPWHNACYSVLTGDQQEPPGLDSLPAFGVRVESDQVIVSLPERGPDTVADYRTLPMAKYKPELDGRTFVILGAGAAGLTAAETLRQDGFEGRVVMITRENQLPCDRTELSKKYLQGQVAAEYPAIPLRPAEFYDQHNIEVHTGKSVAQVDAAAKTLTFEDNSCLNYDTLLVATGGTPRQLKVPGADLANVFVLRTRQDADQIIAAAKQASRAVVIGANFIGMEVAACLIQRQLSVTVVAPGAVPLERVLGSQVGQMIQQVHEDQGVRFQMGTKASQFEGQSKVEAVVLENGERLAADLVVVGVGVQPATELLQGVELDPKDQSVVVDEYLRAAEGLYAAGDIARFSDWRTGKAMRIEHWRLAAQQGQIAAHNMVGKSVKFRGVPFFWTTQLTIGLRYVGYATEWDDIIFWGAPATQKFIAFYVKDDQVLAVAGLSQDTEMAAISELMRLSQMPTVAELSRGYIDLVEQLKH